MASRFFKIGSIYSRVHGFLRKDCVKFEERPLWYDIYAQFPPKYEPKFSRPAPDIEIQEIFYTEDVIRAKIHKKFGHKLGIYYLYNETKTNGQKWIESYNKLIAKGLSENEALKQLEELIEKPVQDSVFEYSPFTETEIASHVIPVAKTSSKLKLFNINFDENEKSDTPPVIQTISKSGIMNETLSEDINVDETIEVSKPVIPMAKTVPKLDEKNKDSK